MKAARKVDIEGSWISCRRFTIPLDICVANECRIAGDGAQYFERISNAKFQVIEGNGEAGLASRRRLRFR
jgi:hypothetical protein